MDDVIYAYREDVKSRSSTARSSKHTRTHCGKGGRVKMPSDYLTQKQQKGLSGEVVAYRLNNCVSYNEFKSWPVDIQNMYLEVLANKYNANLVAIAAMFDMSYSGLWAYLKRSGIQVPERMKHLKSQHLKADAWREFCNKTDADSDAVLVEPDAPVEACEAETNCSTDVEVSAAADDSANCEYIQVRKEEWDQLNTELIGLRAQVEMAYKLLGYGSQQVK